MGRVICGSRKTAFFEEKKANFAARLNCTTHHFDAAANWIEGEFISILRLTTELSHAGLVMSTAKAELKALSSVGSSALFGCSARTRDRGTIDLKKRDRTRTLVALGGSGRPSRCARPTR